MASSDNQGKRVTFSLASPDNCTCFTEDPCMKCVCLSGCCDGNVLDINFSNKEFCKVCISTGQSQYFYMHVLYKLSIGCTCETFADM